MRATLARLAALVALLTLWPLICVAQGTISPQPFITAFDNSGNIINAACVWVYQAGTTTAVNTYTTVALTTANSNPIIADSAGRFTAFLTPGQSYKFVFESACTPPAHGTTLRTADNITAVPSNSGGVDVLGTAGEALTAGQVVYLSDGSGSKQAGQWYIADNTQAYSSVVNPIGMITASIASGSTGTIRVTGTITGLSGLTIGATYYVGAAGATTSTQPSQNVSRLGVADTTTSLLLQAPTALPDIGQCEGRLTLTTGTPVTTADVTAATTLYYAPYRGNRCALYNGSIWTVNNFAQLSIAVPATTSQMYDVFLTVASGVPALSLVAWTNDTTRATALTTQDGVYVLTGTLTSRYLGSFRTTGSSGQTEDSFAKRYVWNYYNRVPRIMRATEATNSWAYTTATYRQANAAATNQLDLVIGVAEEAVSVHVYALCANSSANTQAFVSIGEDSTTTGALGVVGIVFYLAAANDVVQIEASLSKYPAVGRHVYVWLERGDATGTLTWYGDNGDFAFAQAGIVGIING